jgi:hypothetical protein
MIKELLERLAQAKERWNQAQFVASEAQYKYELALKELAASTLSNIEVEKSTPGPLRAGSDLARIRNYILHRKSPIYLDELLMLLGREVNNKNRSVLSASLSVYVRKGAVFSRPMPNHFYLLELEEEPMHKSAA